MEVGGRKSVSWGGWEGDKNGSGAWFRIYKPFVSLVQANLNEQQIASNTLVRALMTTVCYSAIICKRSQGDGGARVVPTDK
jgi:hypothetical protein